MKVVCVFGKYQYGVMERGLSTEYMSFIPALQELGHEVYHFESWATDKRKDLQGLNIGLVEFVLEVEPELLFLVPMEYEIWIETLQYISSATNAKLLCWSTDDSWKYREVSRFIAKGFHGMITTYPNVVERYNSDGYNNVFVSQWGAERLLEPVPSDKCKYDIVFVGSSHGNRKKMIEQIKDNGLQVECFGYGWPNGPVNDIEMIDVINSSRICLNFANSRGENQIKARLFEVPGAGGFLLTEYTEGIEKFYHLDREIVAFNSVTELVKKANYYINKEDERDNIAMAGYMRTKSDHTYVERMRQVVKFAMEEVPGGAIEDLGYADYCKRLSEYKQNFRGRVIRMFLLVLFVPILGKERGPRAARRLVFEVSWRIIGAKTFTAAGLPGRLFPGI